MPWPRSPLPLISSFVKPALDSTEAVQAGIRPDCHKAIGSNALSEAWPIAGKTKIKQEPSTMQPKPKAVPKEVDEKVRDVANAPHACSDSYSNPTAAAAAAGQQGAPSSSHKLNKEADSPAEEAAGTGVFASGASVAPASPADDAEHESGPISCGLIPAGAAPQAAHQAVKPEPGGLGPVPADGIATSAHASDQQAHSHQLRDTSAGEGAATASRVFTEDEGTPNGDGRPAEVGSGWPAEAACEAASSETVKRQESGAEVLRGAAVAEAAAGLTASGPGAASGGGDALFQPVDAC